MAVVCGGVQGRTFRMTLVVGTSSVAQWDNACVAMRAGALLDNDRVQ